MIRKEDTPTFVKIVSAKRNTQVRGTVFMFLATICLASSSILAIYIYREQVGPIPMLTWRFITAAIMLWLFYLSSARWRPFIRLNSARQFWGCVAVGGANTLSQTLYYLALIELDPGLAQLIFSFNPAVIALIMLFFGESLTRLKIVRLVLALLGLYFLTLAGNHEGKPVQTFSVILIIACSFCYAIHVVLYQKLLANSDSRTNTLYVLSAMALIYTVVGLVWGGPTPLLAISGLAWLYILGMALISTVFARLLMFTGIALIGGTQVALIGIAEPLLVLFSSIILLNEKLSPTQWCGAGLVIFSLALVALQRRPRPTKL